MKTNILYLGLALTVVGLYTSCSQKTKLSIDNLPMEAGKFSTSDSSLQQAIYPEWFVDGKFGIWAHWGPQAVPRQGDWYGRYMYISGNFDRNKQKMTSKPHNVYNYHLDHYGHPSEFGYKDIIPLWKAERFDPAELMKLYKQAGAKYFVSMATHHDNFFLWDSQVHRWNSVDMGPHRDIVGEFQKAAQNEGLKFGVSEHLGASFWWFQSAHNADDMGVKAGIPYDGNNPEYADLYHHKAKSKDEMQWLTSNQDFQLRWFECIKELIDNYHPDLLYSDSRLPFDNVGRTMLAHYYNQDIARNGEQTVVYNCKEESKGRFVHDYELGVAADIQEHPWQIDTSIAGWFFDENQTYKPSKELIYMLVDVVSKNGNLLLNVVQTPEGDLEQKQVEIVKEIGRWMDVNGEAIYASRPWKVYGQGPSMDIAHEKGQFAGINPIKEFFPGDLRFTRSKDNSKLYTFIMQSPDQDITITNLDENEKVKSISMLGSEKEIIFQQSKEGDLVIQKPEMIEGSPVCVLKIELMNS